LLISSAAALSMTPLVISTPPKADTGSPANASFQAFSYNNLLDINAAVDLIDEFEDLTFAILKHNNACGLASNFFSVNLIEHCLQVSVEITFLMWIFTVTKLFLAVRRPNCRRSSSVLC